MTRTTTHRRPEAQHSPRVPPAGVLLLSVFAISWAGPLVRFATAPALAVAFWRLAFACLLVAAILAIRGEWREVRGLSGREWGLSMLAGCFLAGHFVAWIASLGLTSVASSTVLVAMQPLWVALLSIPLLREKPGAMQWAGIAVAIAGAAWIGSRGLASGSPGAVRGDLLALAAGVLGALYAVLGRGLRGRISIWPYVALVYGSALLVLAAAMIGTGTGMVGYPGTDWLVFLGLALGPIAIGHTGLNWALRYLPAYVVNLSLLGEPVGATVIAWLLPAIGEIPSASVLLGGGLVLAGIVLAMQRRVGSHA